MFAPATFEEKRGNDSFIAAYAVCLDFDHGQPTVEQVLATFSGTLAAYYSTHSHTPEAPRFRVVTPLSRHVNADEHKRLVLGVKSILPPELTECLDTSCFDKARAHYLPSCPPEQERHAFTGHQDGAPLDVERFMLLGAAVTPVEAPEKKHNAPPSFEFISSSTGEVVNLTAWAAQNPTFDIVAAVGAQYRRGSINDGKQHITCPFEDQHTDQGEDFATFTANASPPHYSAWGVHCRHAHCEGRDRLEFLSAMLEKEWISADQFQTAPTATPPPLEITPPYMNYRAQEFVAELVKRPLDHEELRIHLHLLHVANAAYDGTLPDDSYIIARILGKSEDEWLNRFRPTFIRSGWYVAEGGRIYNPITKRAYIAAQAALMKKITGGSNGGKKAQENRRKHKDS